MSRDKSIVATSCKGLKMSVKLKEHEHHAAVQQGLDVLLQCFSNHPDQTDASKVFTGLMHDSEIPTQLATLVSINCRHPPTPPLLIKRTVTHYRHLDVSTPSAFRFSF